MNCSAPFFFAGSAYEAVIYMNHSSAIDIAKQNIPTSFNSDKFNLRLVRAGLESNYGEIIYCCMELSERILELTNLELISKSERDYNANANPKRCPRIQESLWSQTDAFEHMLILEYANIRKAISMRDKGC
jgi:hypothetical protein